MNNPYYRPNPMERKETRSPSSFLKQQKSILEEALAFFQLPYKMNSRSIVIPECPDCAGRWKVWMLKPTGEHRRSFGKCWKCGNKYNDYTLLIGLGLDKQEVLEFLRQGKWVTAKDGYFDAKDLDFVKELDQSDVTLVKEVNIPPELMKLKDWTSHPVAQYAKRRGILPPISDYVFLNPMTNAVSFPILHDDLLVGFQHRFVNPLDPRLKVKTDAGVPRESSLIFIGDERAPVCVVEGPFDAVAASWFGFHGIATMGKEITRSQAMQIASLSIDNPTDKTVYIAYDNDGPGEQGAIALARYLDSYEVPFIRVLPKDKDIKDINDLLLKTTDISVFDRVMDLDPKRVLNFQKDWNWDLPNLDLGNWM